MPEPRARARERQRTRTRKRCGITNCYVLEKHHQKITLEPAREACERDVTESGTLFRSRSREREEQM